MICKLRGALASCHYRDKRLPIGKPFVALERLRASSRAAVRLAAGAARAALALAAILALSLALWLHSAKAQAGEALFGFGQGLLAWAEARAHSKPRALTVNGLELQLVTLSTQLDVTAALDRFHAACRAPGGLSAAQSADLKDVPGGLGLDGVLRSETETEGIVACFDSGKPLTVGELHDRLVASAKQGDIAALGALRYVIARRRNGVTTLLVLWTQGSMSVAKMFPAESDAPGTDPEGLPRAPSFRRILSAREHGMPYGVTSYIGDAQSPAQVSAWYSRELETTGWAVSRRAKDSLIAHKGTRTVLISAVRTSSGHTGVTLAELG